MTLRKLLQDAEIAVLGNRLNIFCTTIAAGSFARLVTYHDEPLAALLDITAGVMAAALSLSMTECGVHTFYAYHATRNHILKYGKLDTRFVNTLLRKGIFSCDRRQGAYLAARDYNQLEALKEHDQENRSVAPYLLGFSENKDSTAFRLQHPEHDQTT